ncbi:MAG: Nramp family divalent metal transporter [Flavobacteriaceae bacterium]|nr:Nramp family divalent metal transporter [Flavobacteriaceae bacterium]
MKLLNKIGPGPLVAAAFIGPGTVTVCTLAGVKFGFTLLWAMGLSIIATLVLQEMTVRLGLVHGKGLAETVKSQIKIRALKIIGIVLILSAIVIGNGAYEAGNISGGVLGLETFFEKSTLSLLHFEINYLSILIGVIAFLLLFIGKYKIIERALVSLVILMSVSFLIAAILTKPDILLLFKSLFLPKVPDEGFLTIIALVGTTVVPYNLFLHAALVREKWSTVKELKIAKTDSFVAIILGGIVSMGIIVCGAAIQGSEVTNAADLAQGLQPLYGEFATYFLSIGLFAAGISSAITAPLAAAYVSKECFGWKGGMNSFKFRMVWMFILILGILISSLGFRPIEIITFAQVANGILLPVVAGFLLWVMNKKELLGNYKNSVFQNVLGVLIVLTTLVLSFRSLDRVFQWNLF